MLTDVGHLEGGKYNLFSVTRAIMDGWLLAGDPKSIRISKGNLTIKFDIVIKTKKDALFCGYLQRSKAANEAMGGLPQKGTRMTPEKAHALLGHPNMEYTRETAKHLGWELTGSNNQPCQSCAESKAKQKNIPKVTEGAKATAPNERLLQDVATVKARSGVEARVSKPQWQNIVDELTGVIFPAFFKSKDEIVEATCKKMEKLEKAAGKPILYLRQDNAGENKALERRMASSNWKRTTKVEYTARLTPQ